MLKNNAGMSLAEVIVAVVIFAFIATPLLSVFVQSARTDKHALFSALTSYTAQMKIEEAYGMPLTVPLLGAPGYDPDAKTLFDVYDQGGVKQAFVCSIAAAHTRATCANPEEHDFPDWDFHYAYSIEGYILTDASGDPVNIDPVTGDPIPEPNLFKLTVIISSDANDVSSKMEDIIYVRD